MQAALPPLRWHFDNSSQSAQIFRCGYGTVLTQFLPKDSRGDHTTTIFDRF
jgi:hypothetical protein